MGSTGRPQWVSSCSHHNRSPMESALVTSPAAASPAVRRTEELRILHLEDVLSDVELIAWHLRDAGLRFKSKHVAARDTFLRALEEFYPDVVLSDYQLPGFDGLAAL